MATLKLSRDIPFRPVLPAYQPEVQNLKWMETTEKKSLKDLTAGNFDKLVKLILDNSKNGRIKDDKAGFIDAIQQERMNFIRYGAPKTAPKGSEVDTDSVILIADEFTLTNAMLDSVDCALSLQSFAKLRNYEDSFLTYADDTRIVISSQPTSESNRTWEQWRLSGTEFEQVLIRNRHLEKMRKGEIEPKQDKVIFKQYPVLATEDNSLNQAGKLREWIKRESQFLANITKR